MTVSVIDIDDDNNQLAYIARNMLQTYGVKDLPFKLNNSTLENS